MIDFGPCGYFDPERVVLASALDVLKARGISEATLDGLVREVVGHDQALKAERGAQPAAAGCRAFAFEQASADFAGLSYQFAGKDSGGVLARLMKAEVERQKRAEVRLGGSSLLEQKLARKLGDRGLLRDLRNPLFRMRAPAEADESLLAAYFDCWSRVHTVYCHFAAASQDVSAMVYHVIFDESGQFVLTASVDGLVKIFDRSLQLQTSLRGHQRDISILAMSSDNQCVVSVDEGGVARVWEFPSGR